MLKVPRGQERKYQHVCRTSVLFLTSTYQNSGLIHGFVLFILSKCLGIGIEGFVSQLMVVFMPVLQNRLITELQI